MKSKKGSFIDVIGVIITVFIIVVLVVGLGIAYNRTGNALEDAKATINTASYNNSVELVTDQADKYPAFWDFLIGFLAFGLWIGLFISSFILGNNPVFLVVYVILMIPMLVFGAIMGFAGEEFIENSSIATYFADYPITSFIINHFFLYSLFVVVSTGFALYTKIRSGGGVA